MHVWDAYLLIPAAPRKSKPESQRDIDVGNFWPYDAGLCIAKLMLQSAYDATISCVLMQATRAA